MTEKLNKPLAEGDSEIEGLSIHMSDGRIIHFNDRDRSEEHRHDILAFENATVDQHPQMSDTNAD